jgi:hypothetical protein
MMPLFPDGLPVVDKVRYRLPQYHNKGWFNIIGKIRFIFDAITLGAWKTLIICDPDKADPPFYLIDVEQLTFEEAQEISKAYRKFFASKPSICSDINLLKRVVIPLDTIEN